VWIENYKLLVIGNKGLREETLKGKKGLEGVM
jgi:hypothetical protein